jgi:2-iminobutanoate/2-iminopropanoate deaminase
MIPFILRKSNLRSATVLLAMTAIMAGLSAVVLIPRVLESSGGRMVPDLSILRPYGETRAFFDSVSSGEALEDFRAVQAVGMVLPILSGLTIAFILALGIKRCGLRTSRWRGLVVLPFVGTVFDYAENLLAIAIQARGHAGYPLLAAALSAATSIKFMILAAGIVAMVALAWLALSSDRAKRCVSTVRAPSAIGPYSQAVRSNGFIFLSGQLGLDPETGSLADGIAAQAERALDNIQAILEDQGLTMADIVKTTIFLTNMADFQAVNEIYASSFTGDFPARSTVQVSSLPKGGLVEIEAIAKAG